MNYTSKEVYEYISRQTSDPIVERKTCVISGQLFAIYQSDLDFYKKISPTFAGQRFQIPVPTLCPEERQRRRLVFRNERKLYKRKCDFSGKDIISIYSPDKPYKVYDQKIRRSDVRDPMSYGFEFDFTKTFTEQTEKFMLNMPQLSLMTMNNEDSEYTNYTLLSKNIYLSNDCMSSENIYYSNIIKDSKYCCDIADCNNCSYLYQSTGCENCYQGYHLINCNNCENCYFCVGLQGQKNYIFNRPASQEELKDLEKKYTKYCSIFLDFFNSYIKSSDLYSATKCIGNDLLDSSESTLCFHNKNIQSCKYMIMGDNNTDCIDVSICNPNCIASMELISGGEQSFCFSNVACGYGVNILYSYLCMHSSHLFGCIGLRNKSYCIFNKQYTKEEYEIQVAKIITHMQSTGERGEFFHPSLSPFGYNETVVQEYFPLDRVGTQIVASVDNLSSRTYENTSLQPTNFTTHGYHRSNYSSDPVIPAGVETLSGDQIPGDIHTVDDEILKKILICELSGRPFRLQKAELEFYRKHNIPLPRRHPDIRHEERMKLRPGRTLHLRNCDKCSKEMLSVYEKVASTESGVVSQKIYCESCYQQEVYA